MKSSTPDLFIHEKADAKTQKRLGEGRNTWVVFSIVFVKDLNWIWKLRERERTNIKHYLKINIGKRGSTETTEEFQSK